MTEPKSPLPWRVGRKVGRTIYCEEPGTEGRLIGVMDTREDAAFVVECVTDRDRWQQMCRELVQQADALDAGRISSLPGALNKARAMLEDPSPK